MSSQTDPDDARIEAWLRQPPAPLPDQGFSARVLAALPPPSPAPRIWPRTAVCAAGALVGLLVASVHAESFRWSEAVAQIQDTLEPLRGLAADPNFLPAAGLVFACVAFALRRQDSTTATG